MALNDRPLESLSDISQSFDMIGNCGVRDQDKNTIGWWLYGAMVITGLGAIIMKTASSGEVDLKWGLLLWVPPNISSSSSTC